MFLHLCLSTYDLVLFPNDTKCKRFAWGGMCLFHFATDVIIVAVCTHVHMIMMTATELFLFRLISIT